MSESRAVVDLDRDTVWQGLQDGSILLVDVREPNEYAAGHIPGAISNPLSAFDPSALPTGRRIVFSCAAGVRSLHALGFAQAFGLDLHEHYKGGFRDWVMSGGPVER
ncbi:rhodanese-like domain-containing protein [Microvirga flavescens]|uniref:rhodanese-like domain-containing protein n=1 Tax=Microvirga flavescens TaxID=2249811 RepID=UPI000DD9D7F3|nr:rhodanese-like domain-containing protein [Microvirga flavescens]